MPHMHDPQNMEQVIIDSPKQFSDGLNAARTVEWDPRNISHILVAGLGGSWMAAALVRESGIASIPISIHRSYGLPDSIPNGTLVIASSFSGNTEETLSAYHEAREKNLPVVVIASGGELKTLSTQDNIPFFSIPANPPSMQPRSATGYSIGIFAEILSRLGSLRNGASEDIGNLEKYLSGLQEASHKRGQELSMALSGKTPVIYASDRFSTTVRIWKIKINENAKTPAFWNVFPELNHNEMIGWTRPQGNFHAVMLQSPLDDSRITKRMDITIELLQEKGIYSTVVPIGGETRLQQITAALLVGEWTSWHMAITAGIDPTPVSMVEDLKQRLKE